MQTFNLGRAQLVYQRLQAATAGTGAIVKPGHFLQSEQVLVNGQQAYQFYMTKQATGAAIRNSEVRLDQNDTFVALMVGLFVKKELPTKPGKGILQTYENNTVFTAVANELDPDDIGALWNSSLNVKVGNTVFADNLDLNPCRVVNTTAQSSATTRSEHKSFDGYVECLPFISLDGGANNQVMFQGPNYSGSLLQHATASDRNYLVLKMYGFLVSGGSQIAEKVNRALY